MRISRCPRWHWLALGLLLVMSMPAWSQVKQPRELTLNAVTINTSFLEVLNRRGAPAFIGPAVSEADTIQTLMDTAPTGLGGAIPGMPANYMPGMPPMMMGTVMPQAAKVTKPKEEYVVWMYEGGTPGEDDPSAGWYTFIFFNNRGFVVAVVIRALTPNIPTGVSTASGISIGSKMMDIVKSYDWPDQFTTVGSSYYCSYPENNVTFAMEQNTRKVVSIAIGLPFTVTVANPKGAGSPLMAPGMMPGAGPVGQPYMAY